MKIDFAHLNIEPMPNPKPLRVQRIYVEVESVDGKIIASGEGRIVNANLYPAELTRRW